MGILIKHLGWLKSCIILLAVLGSTYAREDSPVDDESEEEKLNYAPKSMTNSEKANLRDEAKDMFYHAYNCYMDKAYPADELMPLSCKGRWRNSEASRGDIDEALGNFSLTLVDGLDTLVVLGDLEEFERAVKLIIKDVSFDHDIVVSLFETNIRMVGGLLSGHILTEHMNQLYGVMKWYRGELLYMARDLATRLLPAFNTSTGIPYPKVNLRYGMKSPKLQLSRDTCTACAGTIILEFACLSRLTGEPVFEEKARQAMDYLWSQRHRGSDLVGMILNIHNGDWVRRDSGVGAGIDSYYEYLLKAYVLLGDDSYLNRFNKHYASVMKYISQGPMLLDVHMHRPHTTSRNFMDSLLAFWPGLQVLKGDIKPAIETHEMLYQVVQRHNFLPEAFTSDFQVHWGQYPLRPEFVESTYLLYQATNDPYYLDVGKKILKSLQKHTWVPCGFAAVKDVRTGALDDRMDSFVLSETFKYLYLLFAEKEELLLDLNEFVFTTEAHLLPLSLARLSNLTAVPLSDQMKESPSDNDVEYAKSCPNIHYLFPGRTKFAENIRKPLKNFVSNVCPSRKSVQRKLMAAEFQPGNSVHMKLIKNMGITIMSIPDGRVQLLHSVSNAQSPEDAEEGILFMQEMIELSKHQKDLPENPSRAVSFLRPGTLSDDDLDNLEDEEAYPEDASRDKGNIEVIIAGPAQFGLQLEKDVKVVGHVVQASPASGCSPAENGAEMKDRIVIMERGNCMFVEKARHIESFGAIGGIVVDNTPNTAAASSPMFAMSGDAVDNVTIPLVFLFSDEAARLLEAVEEDPDLIVTLSDYSTEVSKSIGKGSYSIADDEIITEDLKFDEDRKLCSNEKSQPGKFKIGEINPDTSDPLIYLQQTTDPKRWLNIAHFYMETERNKGKSDTAKTLDIILKDILKKSSSNLLHFLLVDNFAEFMSVVKLGITGKKTLSYDAVETVFKKVRSILNEDLLIVGKFFNAKSRLNFAEEKLLSFLKKLEKDNGDGELKFASPDMTSEEDVRFYTGGEMKPDVEDEEPVSESGSLKDEL